MWKPVQLQGWGEGSTIINAIKAPADKLADLARPGGRPDHRRRVGSLLPGQELGGGTPEPVTLWTEEGAGVLVLALARRGFRQQADNRGARIDGFTIKSADTGGGIIANGYTDYLEISNNRISNNQGFYGGGIRVGHPLLIDPADAELHRRRQRLRLDPPQPGGLQRRPRRRGRRHLHVHRLRLLQGHPELGVRQLLGRRRRRHRPHRGEQEGARPGQPARRAPAAHRRQHGDLQRELPPGPDRLRRRPLSSAARRRRRRAA